MSIKIDYQALRPMDLVLTGRRGPWAAVIKIVTAGIKSWNNKKIPVHCGLVMEIHGQLVLVEMTATGITVTSLKDYTGKIDYITRILRHEVYNDLCLRNGAMARISLDIRYALDYDFKGMFGFVFKRVKHDRKKCYCSEYCWAQWKKDGVMFPAEYEKRVSPFDLERWGLVFCQSVAFMEEIK